MQGKPAKWADALWFVHRHSKLAPEGIPFGHFESSYL